MSDLTVERLKELLDYDPQSGVFTWRVRRGSMVKRGTIAGSPDKDGYLRISVDWTRYRAHRLAWFYVYGIWPRHEIDHINRVKDDNAIANLREATTWENSQNRPMRANNTSGYQGVSKAKGRTEERWVARIQIRGKKLVLGTFHSREEAHAAYQAASMANHTHRPKE